MIAEDGEQAAHGGAPHESGSEQASGCAGAQGNHQCGGLSQHDDQQQLPGELAVENIANRVVADAKNPRHEITDNAEDESADGRPPHFVHRQLFELIFHPVKPFTENYRSHAAEQPENQIEGQSAGYGEIHSADLEHRPQAKKLHVYCDGKRAGGYQRNERSRLEFKEQKFDGNDHAGNGRVEGR